MRIISILWFTLFLVACGGGGTTPDPGPPPPPVQWEAAGSYNVWPVEDPSDVDTWFIVDVGTSPVYDLYRTTTYADDRTGALTFNGNDFMHTGRTDAESGLRIDIEGSVSETGIDSTWTQYRDGIEIDSMDFVGQRLP